MRGERQDKAEQRLASRAAPATEEVENRGGAVCHGFPNIVKSD